MILLLWFYLSGLVILVGAEMNAEIEHASPYGKAVGEKVPGQKRVIGPAAMRAWMARRRRRGEHMAPSAEEVRDAKENPGLPLAAASTEDLKPVSVSRAALPPARRFSDWLITAGVLGAQILWSARALRRSSRSRS